MIELTGSPLQIKWAKDLRARIVGAIEARIALVTEVSLANGNTQEWADMGVAGLHEALTSLVAVCFAETWIEWGKSLDVDDASALSTWAWRWNSRGLVMD